MQTNNSLAVIQPDEWQMMTQMADHLVKSKFLPQSITTPQQAVAIILAGRELGIAPWQSLSTINVIQGKPSVSPQLMLALIQRSGELEDIHYDSTNDACVVTMKRRGQTPHAESFTKADAIAQQLWEKPNWKKQPKVMLRWRAVAACARVVFPDVILGLYTPEEMGADVAVADDGEMTVVVSTPHLPQGATEAEFTEEPAAAAQKQAATPSQASSGGGSTRPVTARDKAAMSTSGPRRIPVDEPERDKDGFTAYRVSRMTVNPRQKDSGHQYILHADGGVNIVSYSADRFREVGYDEETVDGWKEHGKAVFKTPLKVWAKLVKNSKGEDGWHIDRIEPPVERITELAAV